MRIGILSDTHIPFAATDIPRAIYEDFKDVELILHAGDLVEESILQRLKKLYKTVAVCGNMDSPALKKSLPQKEIIKVGKVAIGLIHGEGAPNGLRDFASSAFKGEHLNAVVFGHSHFPFSEVHNGVLYFNPGSPTDRIFAPYNSYGIFELDPACAKGSCKIEAKVIRL